MPFPEEFDNLFTRLQRMNGGKILNHNRLQFFFRIHQQQITDGNPAHKLLGSINDIDIMDIFLGPDPHLYHGFPNRAFLLQHKKFGIHNTADGFLRVGHVGPDFLGIPFRNSEKNRPLQIVVQPLKQGGR